MEDINSRAKTVSDSQVETNNNSRVQTFINSQVDNNTSSRVQTPKVPPAPAPKPGRPRIYADKSEAMKAYRTRVTKLQQGGIDSLDKLSTAVLSDLLAKSLRTLTLTAETPSTPEANEARKTAGRIIKVLRARYTIRLV